MSSNCSEEWVVNSTEGFLCNLSLYEGVSSLKLVTVSTKAHILNAFALILMILALSFNGFVLHALNLQADMKKDVKFLVRNSVCADILLAVACGTRALPVIVGNMMKDGLMTTMCLECFYTVLIGYTAMTQTFTSLVVAIDRFLAVWRPLTYYTEDYSRIVRWGLVVFSWVLSLLLTIPSLWIDVVAGRVVLNENFCFLITMESAFYYFTTVVPAMLWSGLLATVTVYMVTFTIIFISHQRSKDLSESTKKTDLRQKSISMTVTFLLVQLIYIVCYLPGIIISMNSTPIQGAFPQIDLSLNLVVLTIYMMNSVVDPFVYTLRITQIKSLLQKYLRPSQKMKLRTVDRVTN